MENRELDNLFKTGLETTATYHSAEEQWEVVAARLAQPSRRKPVWWWLLGAGMGIVVLSLVVVPKVLESQPVVGAFQIPLTSTKAPPVGAVASTDNTSADAENVTHEAERLPVSTEKNGPIVTENRGQSQRIPAPIAGSGQKDAADYPYEQGKPVPMANTPVDLDVEPMITRQEINPLFSTVSTIMTLPLREIASNTVVNTPLPAEKDLEKPPVVVPAKVARWALEVGVQKDFISSGRIAADDARLQLYSAGAVNFLPHWQVRLAYGAGKIERTITSDPGTYRIPIIGAPLEGDIPNTTQLRYRNQNLEVQVAYHLPKLKKLTFSIHTGLQWNKETDLNAVYEYQGIYQPETIEAVLPDTKLLLSDLTAGVDLRYPLISAFSIRGGFQQYFSLNGSDAFRWPLRRRVHLGLSYQF